MFIPYWRYGEERSSVFLGKRHNTHQAMQTNCDWLYILVNTLGSHKWLLLIALHVSCVMAGAWQLLGHGDKVEAESAHAIERMRALG
jgi:hypothetical protein